MNARQSPLNYLLVTPSGQLPSATDLRDLMARLGVDKVWSDAAVEQLIRAAAAADRWLAEQPDEAARLVEDPAGAVQAMQRSGLLTEPVADLLETLRSLGKRGHAKSEARSRRARTALRPTTARFGVKPALRLRSQPAIKAGGGECPAPYDERRGHEGKR